MSDEDTVSLWVGHADTPRILERYLADKYSEDGDSIPSPFSKDFGISWFDEDFREAHVLEEPSRFLRDLLTDNSYDDVILPRFIRMIGETLPEEANAVILLYRFKYDESVKTSARRTVQMRYVGSVKWTP
jgi:Immunity protein 22